VQAVNDVETGVAVLADASLLSTLDHDWYVLRSTYHQVPALGVSVALEALPGVTELTRLYGPPLVAAR
jgi:hypothetical protein